MIKIYEYMFIIFIILFFTSLLFLLNNLKKKEEPFQKPSQDVTTYSARENSFSDYQTKPLPKNKNTFNVKNIKECAAIARKINDCYGFTYNDATGQCTLSDKFLQHSIEKNDYVCNKLNPICNIGNTNSFSFEDIINNSIFSCKYNGKINLYRTIDKTGNIFQKVKNYKEINKDLNYINEFIGKYNWT